MNKSAPAFFTILKDFRYFCHQIQFLQTNYCMLLFLTVKNRFLLVLLSFSLFFSACSTDFDLADDWKEGMALYGLINPEDSVHYVRINKVFLDPETDALVIAQNPDSIYYYENLDVTIRELPNGPEWTAQQIDGNLTDINKSEGIFSNERNILYRFNFQPNLDRNYQITATNSETGYTVSSVTGLVGELQMTFPTNPVVTQINKLSTNRQTIRFNTPENGRVYDLKIRFLYEEWEIGDSDNKELKSVEWTAFSGLTSPGTSGGTLLTFQYDNREFYNQLANRIPADNSKRRRVKPLGSIQYIFISGGEEIYNYIISEGAQSGLSDGSAGSVYSNIENGYGVWSSRSTSSFGDFRITPTSVDSLACGSLTRQLNFADRAGFFDCN
ncbi:MAG: DUF4249 family protein [Chitinophagaceae bacterium]|nr:MAG: DUF4249 family protein [Chitinophagaceae bacterium]